MASAPPEETKASPNFVATKFWTVDQNNSGGSFDHDPEHGIGYAICVEAVDDNHARGRFEQILGSYGQCGDCSCCGPRWSLYLYEDEGSPEPELYEEPLKGGWGLPSYVHYLDGRIEAREASK